jgi:hypothetical protein
MKKLFRVDAAEGYRYPLLNHIDKLKVINKSIHTKQRKDDWNDLDGLYWAERKDAKAEPDVAPLYFPGILVLNARIKTLLEQFNFGVYEFIPVLGLGADWWILSCLREPFTIDAENSNTFRSMDGRILLASNLVVEAQPLGEFFTVADMNAPLLFCDQLMRDFFNSHRISGLKFSKVGHFSGD